MKHVLKKYLSLLALISIGASVGTAKADLYIRSQSVDSARELVGWTNHINLYDIGENYSSLAITGEYTQSFRSNRIAQSLFGTAITNPCDTNCPVSFTVSGSRAANRGANDLLADYFGLPTDFVSTISLRPKIQNYLVDFDYYLGLDEYMCGLWFRVHAPIVHARWKINMSEKINNAGVLGYDAGYFTPSAVPHDNLNTSFSAYLQGQVPNLGDGHTFEPLRRDLVSNSFIGSSVCQEDSCALKKTALSDIQFVLGYNFWQNEDYHVGLGLRVVAPTGTKVGSGKYGNQLFQPQIGNGRHAEVGGMFTSHYTFWRNCDDTSSAGFYCDANITTLLANTQCRVFDLCFRGDNSKYMLAMPFRSNYGGRTFVTNNLQGAATSELAPTDLFPATSQFNQIFTPVANVAQAPVRVHIPVQVDLTAMFNYTYCNFSWDIGYNLWATSCEKIRRCATQNVIPNGQYVLKGDAYVYGFDFGSTPAALRGNVPLSGSQDTATIHSGNNFVTGNTIAQASANPGVDNALFAYGDGVGFVASNRLFASPTPPANTVANPQTRTSIQAIFLSDEDLDLVGARSRGLTNKIFTHFSWTGSEHTMSIKCCGKDRDLGCYVPFIGFGGKAEFASHIKDSAINCGNASCAASCAAPSVANCASNCFNDCGTSCLKTALSEWGVWIKGGFDF